MQQPMARKSHDDFVINKVGATLVAMLEASRRHLIQTIDGFQGPHWTHVPGDGIACAAWILGHVVLVDRHVLDTLEIEELAELPEGWEALHTSRLDDSSLYEFAPTSVLLDQFAAHRTALIAAVRALPTSAFDSKIDPPPEDRYNPLCDDLASPLFDYRTTGEMIGNMHLYTCQLWGELCIVRQSLGMKPHDDDWFLGPNRV